MAFKEQEMQQLRSDPPPFHLMYAFYFVFNYSSYFKLCTQSSPLLILYRTI
jgi:hypothetical protein